MLVMYAYMDLVVFHFLFLSYTILKVEIEYDAF